MVFIKQQVIGRAFPPTVPVNSFNDAGENGFKVKWGPSSFSEHSRSVFGTRRACGANWNC